MKSSASEIKEIVLVPSGLNTGRKDEENNHKHFLARCHKINEGLEMTKSWYFPYESNSVKAWHDSQAER